MFQDASGGSPAHLRHLLQLSPLPQQGHVHHLLVPSSHGQASTAAPFAPAVGGDAAEDPPQPFRQRIVKAFVLQLLRGPPKVQRMGCSYFRVRGGLLHQSDQSLLQVGRFLEASAGRPLNPGVDEGGQGGVVAGDAPSLQVVERSPHSFGVQSRRGHQLVGGDALVGISVDEGLGDGEQLAAVGVGDDGPCQPGAGLLHRTDAEG